MTLLYPDQIVCLGIIDHATGSKIVDKQLVYGRVVRVEEDHVILTNWESLDPDPAVREHNTDYNSIIKSAIKSVRVLT